MRELVMADGAAKAIGPYSPALKVGNLLFLSGSIPLDPVSGQHPGVAGRGRCGLFARRADDRVHG